MSSLSHTSSTTSSDSVTCRLPACLATVLALNSTHRRSFPNCLGHLKTNITVLSVSCNPRSSLFEEAKTWRNRIPPVAASRGRHPRGGAGPASWGSSRHHDRPPAQRRQAREANLAKSLFSATGRLQASHHISSFNAARCYVQQEVGRPRRVGGQRGDGPCRPTGQLCKMQDGGEPLGPLQDACPPPLKVAGAGEDQRRSHRRSRYGRRPRPRP